MHRMMMIRCWLSCQQELTMQVSSACVCIWSAWDGHSAGGALNFFQVGVCGPDFWSMGPGGPLEWQEGVSGSSMDSQKAP